MRLLDHPVWLCAAMVVAFSGLLTVCAPAQVGDRLSPGLGGLPAGTPARPVTPYDYPAVHDMPPPRQTAPMSEEDRKSLEDELTRIRDRQTTRTRKKPSDAN